MRAEGFSWFAASKGLVPGGMVLRRGGAHGVAYASVSEHDKVWVASLNLHRPTSSQRSAVFATELEAIEAIEVWVDRLFEAN